MARPDTTNKTASKPKRPRSPAAITSEAVESTFFKAFESLCERVTAFVSGHWGTLTAVVLVVFGCVVFLRGHDDSLAAVVERFMTMLSLALLFLLQRSQTKATLSLQVKLNEVLKGMSGTSNEMINVEHLSEDELSDVHEGYDQHHGRDDPR